MANKIIFLFFRPGVSAHFLRATLLPPDMKKDIKKYRPVKHIVIQYGYMINTRNHTIEEIDRLYTAIENAVTKRKPIEMSKLYEIVKERDFFLEGWSSIGLVFQLEGLKWTKNDKTYNVLIHPQVNSLHKTIPDIEWVPVITYNDRNGLSSGDLSMIKKENRYIQAFWTE